MKLPEIALKNRMFVLTVVALAVFVGFRSFKTMPRAEDPFLSTPNYAVVVVLPGMSPEDMEELVADPIEEAMDELDDITEIRTEISNGLAIINVEASFGIDYDDKYDDIVGEVNQLRQTLPSGIVMLDVTQFKPEDMVVVRQYALVSEGASYAQLYDEAERFEDLLNQSELVKKVEIEASPEERVRISLDFRKMANLGVNLSQVAGVLSGNNVNIPGGEIKSGTMSFNVKSSGKYGSLDEIRNTAIGAHEGKIVYLRHIAEVGHAYEDQRWIARYGAKKSIFVTVTQKKGGNIMTLAGDLDKKEANFSEKLPVSISLETAFDQAPAVKGRLDEFVVNLVQGIVLVGVIILVFLGWRPALVVMVVIPLSILLAITVLNFSGYALQQISIASLVIALGLLVDNGIVVIENIVRFRRDGYTLAEAAAKGTGEVGYSIISSTLTTVLAFAPLAFMASGPGVFLRSMPLTVIYVLTASLILALTFTPIMARKILKQKGEIKTPVVSRHLEKLIEKFYAPALRFALRKGWVVLGSGIITLLGALSLFPSIGVSFFPTADKPMLLISADHPYTRNILHTDSTMRFIGSVLDTMDYVDSYVTNAGHGNPQVYYNRQPEEYKSYHGEALVNFKEWDPDKFYATLANLRKTFADYPDAKITFSELKNGAPFEAPIEVMIMGKDLEVLRKISFDIEKIVDESEGTLDVANPLANAKTDIKVNINRDKAALLNVSLLDIDKTVRAGLGGLRIDDVSMDVDNEEYPLIIRMPFDGKNTVEDFGKMYVTNRMGRHIPLSQLAVVEFEQDYAQINHYNTERNTAVTANVTNPDKTKAITEAIIPKLDAYDWPDGYRYRMGGEYESQTESFGDLGTLLFVAMVLIFAVLVLQFRSVSQPLIIFSAIPLAVSGSFVALYLTNWSFSFFAFIGFISLVGIVVNNSIILVDYTNQLMESGMAKTNAITTAAHRRFTPIVLTTLTTILGLLPLTLSGTSLWSPLGWTLIGGMISSTLLTLLVVPILYQWFTKGRKDLAEA
ncbi:multidrug transporter AcrB (plasmid) [Fulvitalea axinellae]|uniref:Multidrug transporter AcrB n=1 Tax=Fulvitalea axinellae TaxID=1182444 RepID=A0AAU9D709_9BACT|nr:multidrug transporter AcrB [Fulvitalea axinellae]